MKSIRQYSKENNGITIENAKCLDSINETFAFKRLINKKNKNIVLRDVTLKEDIELPNKKVIAKGTKFGKVELTTDKQVKLFKLVENSIKPYKVLLKHSLNEDMFPNVNDGRVDGPFYPDSSVNGVLLNAISAITKIKDELMNLKVQELSTLLQGLGNTFEEQVIREIIMTYADMKAFPIDYGQGNGV